MLLCWFALGISAAVLGFLFLGQYTERAHVPGVITVSGISSPQMAAEIYGAWPLDWPDTCRQPGFFAL